MYCCSVSPLLGCGVQTVTVRDCGVHLSHARKRCGLNPPGISTGEVRNHGERTKACTPTSGYKKACVYVCRVGLSLSGGAEIPRSPDDPTDKKSRKAGQHDTVRPLTNNLRGARKELAQVCALARLLRSLRSSTLGESPAEVETLGARRVEDQVQLLDTLQLRRELACLP